jgi:hypothetical protein
MARSIEKASGTAGASVSISRENERKLLEGQSARSLRRPAFQREKLADCSLVARQNETPALVSKLPR